MKLIEIFREKFRRNSERSARKLAAETHVSRSAVQRVLKDDFKIKSHKIAKQLLLSDATKKMRFE